MSDLLAIKNYRKLLMAFRELCESMPRLIEVSGLKHRQIYQHPALKEANLKMGKDTFYRRLQHCNWTIQELNIILPFLMEQIKVKNKEFYRQFRLEKYEVEPSQ